MHMRSMMRSLRSAARRRRGWLAALALTVTGGVIVTLVLLAGSPSPTTASGAAKGPAGAATVKRRNLVSTDTEAGTLSYANPQTVYDRLSGTITWLPSVGQVIRPGQTLFRVNGSPVILMNGTTPAYRTLSSADTEGADVLELNRNLVALGFNANGIVVDDLWQPATTLGIELLQESLGETATGTLSLGRVVFLPGPQLVSTVDGTVGNTANGGSSGTPAATTADPPAPEFVGLTTPAAATTTTTSTSSSTTTPTTTPTQPSPNHKHKKGPTPSLAALLALLKAESAQLKAEAEQLKAEQSHNGQGNSPSGSPHGSNKGSGGNTSGGNASGGNASGGNTSGGNTSGGNTSGGNTTGGTGANGSNSSDSGSTGEAVLATTSTHLVVTVDLDASLQSEAKVGERVTVQLPAGNTVTGKVTAVSSVAQSSSSGDNGSGNGSGGGGGGGGNGGGSGGNGSGSGSSSTIPVTITLSGHHRGAGLDEAAVSVNFAQARARHVLSVPVTALLAVGGGNYAVQMATAPHSLIPVTVGLFAAGYVQISGAGIHSGLQVTDSQG